MVSHGNVLLHIFCKGKMDLCMFRCDLCFSGWDKLIISTAGSCMANAYCYYWCFLYALSWRCLSTFHANDLILQQEPASFLFCVEMKLTVFCHLAFFHVPACLIWSPGWFCLFVWMLNCEKRLLIGCEARESNSGQVQWQLAGSQNKWEYITVAGFYIHLSYSRLK